MTAESQNQTATLCVDRHGRPIDSQLAPINPFSHIVKSSLENFITTKADRQKVIDRSDFSTIAETTKLTAVQIKANQTSPAATRHSTKKASRQAQVVNNSPVYTAQSEEVEQTESPYRSDTPFESSPQFFDQSDIYNSPQGSEEPDTPLFDSSILDSPNFQDCLNTSTQTIVSPRDRSYERTPIPFNQPIMVDAQKGNQQNANDGGANVASSSGGGALNNAQNIPPPGSVQQGPPNNPAVGLGIAANVQPLGQHVPPQQQPQAPLQPQPQGLQQPQAQAAQQQQAPQNGTPNMQLLQQMYQMQLPMTQQFQQMNQNMNNMNNVFQTGQVLANRQAQLTAIRNSMDKSRFKGNDSNVSAHSWLRKFDGEINLYGLIDDEKIKLVATLLSGAALDKFHEMVPTPTVWATFKVDFAKLFTTELTPNMAFKAFLTLRQGEEDRHKEILIEWCALRVDFA